MIRALKASEVEVKPILVTEKVARLLCYKKHFVDERILEEEYGFFGFEVEPLRNPIEGEPDGTLIKVHDPAKEFSTRSAFGYPSTNSCGEKDSMKNAGYHLGIGVELYTAPDIHFFAGEYTVKEDAEGKFHCYDKFVVDEMKVAEIDGEKRIVKLTVTNLKTQVTKVWINAEGVHDMLSPSQVVNNKDKTVVNSPEPKPLSNAELNESAKKTAEIINRAEEKIGSEEKKAESKKAAKEPAPSEEKKEAPKPRAISKAQIKFITDMLEKAGISMEEAQKRFGFDALENIASKRASEIITELKAAA